MDNVESIRDQLVQKYRDGAHRGNGTIELQGVSFIVDEDEIFKGTRNQKYIDAEIEWYNSCSKKVDDLAEIYGKRVQIWDSIADSKGEVNSNYGWCIFSPERGAQYFNAVKSLVKNNLTRQATMIYQDPLMHIFAGKDFTCTNAVNYYLEPHDLWDDHFVLNTVVQMRSNDAVFGFNNDLAWQKHVINSICKDLYWGFKDIGHYVHDPINVVPGTITWQVASFHVYERHFHHLEVLS